MNPNTNNTSTSQTAAKDPTFNTTTTDPPPYPTPPSSPIDSSMTLVILIVSTALVFVGLFAVFLRRSAAAARRSSAPTRPRVKAGVGLDQAAVDSLPVVAYGEAAKQRMINIDECTICLSEFAEGESVKVIPCCGHVFHPKCVDTWLGTHVTCPLCRSDELFGDGRGEEVCLDVVGCRSDDGSRNQS